jgi:hypothetical protein
VSFPESCRHYDPSTITLNGHDVGETPPPLSSGPVAPWFSITVPGDVQGAAVLALARQYTAACVIGGWYYDSAVPADVAMRVREDEQLRMQMEAIENAWHPVYYWK